MTPETQLTGMSIYIDRKASACLKCTECGAYLVPDYGEEETLWVCDCGAVYVARYIYTPENN